MPRTVAVGLAQALLEERPIKFRGELRQWMIEVDDPIEAGAEQVLLTTVAANRRAHRLLFRRQCSVFRR